MQPGHSILSPPDRPLGIFLAHAGLRARATRACKAARVGVWDAAGEGWVGQCSWYTCAKADDNDANSQIKTCAACAVRPVWTIAV